LGRSRGLDSVNSIRFGLLALGEVRCNNFEVIFHLMSIAGCKDFKVIDTPPFLRVIISSPSRRRR
jgi:hypothetical protein